MNDLIPGLREDYSALAARVGAPAAAVHFHVQPTDSGAAHVEVEGSDLCYVVTERGRELERRRTQNPDTMLYWLLQDLTFSMASAFAAKHRRAGEDFRRSLFAKQLELLGSLKAEWRLAREADMAAILQRNPYRDGK